MACLTNLFCCGKPEEFDILVLKSIEATSELSVYKLFYFISGKKVPKFKKIEVCTYKSIIGEENVDKHTIIFRQSELDLKYKPANNECFLTIKFSNQLMNEIETRKYLQFSFEFDNKIEQKIIKLGCEKPYCAKMDVSSSNDSLVFVTTTLHFSPNNYHVFIRRPFGSLVKAENKVSASFQQVEDLFVFSCVVDENVFEDWRDYSLIIQFVYLYGDKADYVIESINLKNI